MKTKPSVAAAYFLDFRNKAKRIDMKKKYGFILTLLFMGALNLNAQQLAVSFSKTYNPALPLYGFRISGQRVPITRNLTSTECLINTSAQKAALESASTSNGIFTAKILLTINGQNALRWTFSLQSGTDGDYNYVTHVSFDDLITKVRRDPFDWNGSAGKAMELVGLLVGSLDMFYDTPLVYAENPTAEKKRLADAAAEKQRQEAAATEKRKAEEAEKRTQELAAAEKREQKEASVKLQWEETYKSKAAPENEFEVELTQDGKGARIKKYTGSREEVVIPAEIEGFPVVEIAWLAFGDTLKAVVIPYSVMSMEFSGCENLSSVVIGTGIKEISDTAFSKCTALATITIPDNVVRIGVRAFAESGLTAITIPDSVTAIGTSAFEDCRELTSVVIGKGAREIPAGVFEYCTALTTVTIPGNVVSIGYKAFAHSGLTAITIPDSVTAIYHDAFNYCSSLASVIINPVEKRTWGSDVFDGCRIGLAPQAALRKAGYTENF
jgi:hypothetical protein